MPFPTSPIAATLPADQYALLVKLLTVHYAYPLPYPLAGAYFEELFAATVGGKREKRKLLFDVLKDGIGWSLKTLLWQRLEAEGTFEVVLQRCDILKNRHLTLDSPVATLGQHILQRFNNFCETSAAQQSVSDTRAGFLIRNRPERDFLFLQQRYRLYQRDDLQWQWANAGRASLLGYVGQTLVFRWYRSGTQLFGVYRIPAEAHRFQINWRRADLDETIAFFTRSGVVRVDAES